MSTARSITPASEDWPIAFAPRWASSAEIEDDGATITFSGCWTVPAIIRDVEPLDVVTVSEQYSRGAHGLFEAHGPRVSIGSTGVWADDRLGEIAVTLREIADALDPTGTA